MKQYNNIGDYAIIGNGRSAALVSRSGSIDWLCWPRFDSPALFAAILDPLIGGFWSIRPVGDFSTSRAYREHTVVVDTTFSQGENCAVLTDCMTVFPSRIQDRFLAPEQELLRVVDCKKGVMQFNVEFVPRPSFGKIGFKLTSHPFLGIRLSVGSRILILRSNMKLAILTKNVIGTVTLKAGDSLFFSMTIARETPGVIVPLGEYTKNRIEQTCECWREWVGRMNYDGPYKEMVIRSALTLKLLYYAPSNGIIAALTTSLPERIGGGLNWDYRFCWIRDSALTARALSGLGYIDEAKAFVAWLLHTTRLSRPKLHVLYDVFGGITKKEKELSHLSGYKYSSPVRVGNAAANQLQLDIYGEVLSAAAALIHHRGIDNDTRVLFRQLGDFVCKNWDKPDKGIWEARWKDLQYTHSKLLCWSALDRLVLIADKGYMKKDRHYKKYKKYREVIAEAIREKGWNEKIGTYVQSFGSDKLDAALILLTWHGFEEPDSPRMKKTYQAIIKRLQVEPGLVYRYDQSHKQKEGTFLMCSFWIIEYLAKGGGSLQEAKDYFEKTASFSNDLGLFSEEVDPVNGDALGNFPQAFSHIGLINAALSLNERIKNEERSLKSGAL